LQQQADSPGHAGHELPWNWHILVADLPDILLMQFDPIAWSMP